MEERRTGLYVVIVLILVLLLAGAVFLLWLLFYTPREDALPPGQDQVQMEEPEPEPELPKASDIEAYKPPEPLTEDGRETGPDEEEHLYGTLRMSYDGNALVSETEDPKTRITLLTKEGETLPRLDAQVLDGAALGESERVRLAVGLLQAYYTDPPSSKTLNAAPDADLEQGYVVEAPAVGETPAMTARVRFLPTGPKLWYLVLLYPSGTAPDEALVTAYEGAAAA